MTRRIAILACALLGPACTSSATQEPTTRATVHYVVAVDRSTSIREAEAESARRTVDGLIQGLGYGDRLTAFAVYSEGRRTGTQDVTREMPAALNPNHPLQSERSALASAQASLARAVAPIFDAPPTKYTDLFSSLRQAEEQLRQSRADARVLVLLSDMLHCRADDPELCMDRSTWKGPPAGWMDRHFAGGAQGGLAGTCVWVVGAETASARDLAVRDFWAGWFGRAGAEFDAGRYYHGLDRAPGVC